MNTHFYDPIKFMILELMAYPEVANIAVIEVPLLPSEVTGHEAILEFSRLMVSEGQEKRKVERRLDPSQKSTLYDFENGEEEDEGEWVPKVGDSVVVQNLVKKPEYNGQVGKIVSFNEENGRYGVKCTMKGEKEGDDQVVSLAIQRYIFSTLFSSLYLFSLKPLKKNYS